MCRGKPVTILAPVFGSTQAVIDDMDLKCIMDNQGTQRHMTQLCNDLFQDLCPNYASSPCAAALEVHQVTMDESYPKAVLPLHQYI